MYNILIVDDDQVVNDALATLFKKAGFAVFQALKCDSALSIIEEKEIDVAIIDIRMPRSEEGLDLAKNIKKYVKEVKNETIGVFIITSVVANRDYVKESINTCHADAFIDKPWDNEKLLKNINNYLDRRLENDPIIKSFEEWSKKKVSNDFKIEILSDTDKSKTLNANDILDEMKKNTIFGRNFKKSILQMTIQIIKRSSDNQNLSKGAK